MIAVIDTLTLVVIVGTALAIGAMAIFGAFDLGPLQLPIEITIGASGLWQLARQKFF